MRAKANVNMDTNLRKATHIFVRAAAEHVANVIVIFKVIIVITIKVRRQSQFEVLFLTAIDLELQCPYLCPPSA